MSTDEEHEEFVFTKEELLKSISLPLNYGRSTHTLPTSMYAAFYTPNPRHWCINSLLKFTTGSTHHFADLSDERIQSIKKMLNIENIIWISELQSIPGSDSCHDEGLLLIMKKT
eukprot:159426_1